MTPARTLSPPLWPDGPVLPPVQTCCDCAVAIDWTGRHREGCEVGAGCLRAAHGGGVDPLGLVEFWACFQPSGIAPGISKVAGFGYGCGVRPEHLLGDIRRVYMTSHNGRWTTLFVGSKRLDPRDGMRDCRAVLAATLPFAEFDAAAYARRVGGTCLVSDLSRTVWVPWRRLA